MSVAAGFGALPEQVAVGKETDASILLEAKEREERLEQQIQALREDPG